MNGTAIIKHGFNGLEKLLSFLLSFFLAVASHNKFAFVDLLQYGEFVELVQHVLRRQDSHVNYRFQREQSTEEWSQGSSVGNSVASQQGDPGRTSGFSVWSLHVLSPRSKNMHVQAEWRH